jgi:hypothetical protein
MGLPLDSGDPCPLSAEKNKVGITIAYTMIRISPGDLFKAAIIGLILKNAGTQKGEAGLVVCYAEEACRNSIMGKIL